MPLLVAVLSSRMPLPSFRGADSAKIGQIGHLGPQEGATCQLGLLRSVEHTKSTLLPTALAQEKSGDAPLSE